VRPFFHIVADEKLTGRSTTSTDRVAVECSLKVIGLLSSNRKESVTRYAGGGPAAVAALVAVHIKSATLTFTGEGAAGAIKPAAPNVDVQREIPAHLSQWRIAESSNSVPPNSADAFLLNYIEAKDGCLVAAQQVLGKSGATIVVENPKEGNWRIVIRTREPIKKAVMYDLREASLTPSATPIEVADEKHASGATWSVALPAKQSDAQYVAFHIAGAPEKEVRQDAGAKNGVSIALTALDANAP